MSGRAANGEGTLYQRKSDGRWVGAVFLGYDITGRPLRKTVSAKSRADAVKKLRELQQNTDKGLPPPDDQLTVTGLFEHWLTQVLPHRVAPATVTNYTSLFNTHIKPALGRKRITKLQPDDVQRFINLKLDGGLSPRTVRHLRGLLVQTLNYAVRQGSVVRNVAGMTEGPRQQAGGEGRSLTVQQARSLLNAAEGDRLESLYVLMLSTGMRPGEAFGLPWRNVDLSDGRVTIKQALVRQKGGNVIGRGKVGKKGWRTVQIPDPVVKALTAHRDRQDKERVEARDAWEDNDLVFCTPVGTLLDPDNHRKGFSKLTERAGIGRWHPHELRHSATSIMLAQGVPIDVVSKTVGHTSIRITADVYGHLLDGQKALTAKAMESALWG
jgi:integrase